MNFERIKQYIKDAGLPNFRIAQVREAVFNQGISSWQEARNLPAALREKLMAEQPLLSFEVTQVVCSQKDRVAKALLTLRDGLQIETVLLKPQDTWSVCVSSQVGCALHCSFAVRAKWVLNGI